MGRLRGSLKSVRLISPEPKFKLRKSPTFEWLPAAIDSADLLEPVREKAPVDGKEIVEWMQHAVADNAILDAFEEEYSICSARGAGRVGTKCGDPYTPGVHGYGVRVVSEPGFEVRRKGYGTLKTPVGSFRVSTGYKALFAKQDMLVWAVLPAIWMHFQWILAFIRWLDLAAAPIKRSVRFPTLKGRVAPNFFKISPGAPLPVCILDIGVTTDKTQSLILRGRGRKGRYHEVHFEESIKLERGENEFRYYVTGFPFVDTFTLELQPEDGTKTVLDYIEVFP